MSDAVQAVTGLLRHHDGVDPLLIGVDGASGAGKSTLADALVAELGGAIVHLDDFYRPMEADRRAALDPQAGFELYFDWQRLIGEALDPLVLGEPAVFRRFDWQLDALGDDVVAVDPSGVIVVEGVYAHRPQLRGYYDIAVFVDTPAPVRRQRCEVRTDTPDWMERWAAAEDWYLSNADPRPGADLVVTGR
ncbi:MAG: uridine kinase family protein [Acidimicrobiales bacterium]